MTQHYPPQPPPHGAYPPPYAAQPAPKKKRRWPWIVGAILLLFVVVGVASGGDEQTTQNRPGTPSGVTSGSGGAAAQAPAQQDAPAQPEGAFGPGTYEVGVDIEPGKYKTAGGGTLGSCYWARLKDTNGELDSIIANGNAQGPTTVTISKTDGAFETTCESWTKAG